MKSPAFQFYAQDFLVGAAELSNEEVGIYIKLLCFEWTKGALPADVHTLARMTGGKRQSVEAVLQKFTAQPDGTWINDRLEFEREKQQRYSESRKANAMDRWSKRNAPKEHKPCISDAYASAHAKHVESIGTCKTDAFQSSSSFSEKSEKDIAHAHPKPSVGKERQNQPDAKRDLWPFKPLQTPEFEAAWVEWLAYKVARREADPTEQYLSNTRRVNLDQLARLGVARAIAIVRFSLGRGSKGLILDPKPEELAAFLPKPAAQASAARQSDETEAKAAALARAVREGLPEAAELKKSASTAILSAAMAILDVDGKNKLHRLGRAA